MLINEEILDLGDRSSLEQGFTKLDESIHMDQIMDMIQPKEFSKGSNAIPHSFKHHEKEIIK